MSLVGAPSSAQAVDAVRECHTDHPEADALEYRISLNLYPEERQIDGVVDYRFRALEDLDAVTLDLLPPPSGYTVTFETRSGGRTIPVERNGIHILVPLGRVVPAGDEFVLTARLKGRPDGGVYFAKTRSGAPCVFTDHFPEHARAWLPCEDNPEDRAHVEFSVSAPEGYAVIAPAERDPLPTYLFAFLAAPLVDAPMGGEATGDSALPMRMFAFPESLEAALEGAAHHREWLRELEERIGPYPYSRYRVVQSPTRFGGMENASNTFMALRSFDSFDRGEGTMAHEFAHQWWGDACGYAAWEEIWLSEGFASWFGPYLVAQTGGESLREAMATARKAWLASPEGRTRPVRDLDWRDPSALLNRNSYQKGAWVVHMLRRELGEELFWEAMRAWYADGAERAANRTSDFRAAVEAVVGRDLAWFFDQWLERPGCPELLLTFSDGELQLRQVQDGAPFRFPLDFEWTREDGTVERRTFAVEKEEHSWPLGPGGIASYRVDPEVELLYRRKR